MDDTTNNQIRARVAAHCGNAAAVDALHPDTPTSVAPDLDRWSDGWSRFAARLRDTPDPDPDGRIWFPGNPYPGGHRLEDLSIKLAIEADKLAITLKLRSSYYCEESTIEDPENLDDLRDWQSVGVWNNYGQCDFGGTIIRTPADPVLDLSGPVSLRADAQDGDALEGEYDDLAFWQCYILGHDSIADHTIRLVPNGDGTFQLMWHGRVAMTYAGNDNLDHMFLVEHASVPALCVTVAPETLEAQAREWLALFVANASDYTYVDGTFTGP